MKKFLKIFVLCLVFAILVAFVVFYFIDKEGTKEFINYIINAINQPLPIVGISILGLGAVAYTFFTHSSIGKKGLAVIKESLSNTECVVTESAKKCENKLAEYENKVNEQLAVLKAYSNEIDTLANYIVQVCETSPNAKIKALGEEIKGKYQETKEELQNALEQSGNELSNIIETKKQEINTDKEYIKELVISALKEINYGEQGKDSSSNQE